MKRVVITGMGTINPLAQNVQDTWQAMLAGKSGVETVKAFDITTFTSKVAGEVKDFDYKTAYPESWHNKAKRMDPFVHYAAHATREALDHSGVQDVYQPENIGIVVGSGIGGIHAQMANVEQKVLKGHRRVSPFYIPSHIGNIASGFLSAVFDVKGPNTCVQTACATGNHALGQAMMIIQSGMADAMIAGGSEGTIVDMSFAGFCNMKALSTKYNDTPNKASRPFDKSRDGFVMSEGAGILILEDYEKAKARGANILCELTSVGMTGDAYDMVSPHPEGEGAARSMKMALDLGKANASEVGYINAHATSTPLGDKAESKAIIKALNGDQSNVHVGSTKSMTGHLLGATAGLEAITCIMALNEGKIPPTINIDDLDEECGLKCINTEVIEKEMNVTMSNSFGFGGHNSTALFRKI